MTTAEAPPLKQKTAYTRHLEKIRNVGRVLRSRGIDTLAVPEGLGGKTLAKQLGGLSLAEMSTRQGVIGASRHNNVVSALPILDETGSLVPLGDETDRAAIAVLNNANPNRERLATLHPTHNNPATIAIAVRQII
jgi:hypothetical protein